MKVVLLLDPFFFVVSVGLDSRSLFFFLLHFDTMTAKWSRWRRTSQKVQRGEKGTQEVRDYVCIRAVNCKWKDVYSLF